MTSLSAPIPPTPEPAPAMPWRELVYPIALGVWLVVNVIGLGLGWPRLWQAAAFCGPLFLAVLDLAFNGHQLDVEPVEATPTHMPCCGCGAFLPRHELKADDGLCCAACAARQIPSEVA
jgi:hypothetical protein